MREGFVSGRVPGEPVRDAEEENGGGAGRAPLEGQHPGPSIGRRKPRTTAPEKLLQQQPADWAGRRGGDRESRGAEMLLISPQA